MEMNWNYIWAALVVNFLLVYIVPKLIKKPTGVKVVDDTILFLNSQKSFLLSSSIVMALVIYVAHYWVDGAKEGSVSPSSPEKF
jgi:hypothetical protein